MFDKNGTKCPLGKIATRDSKLSAYSLKGFKKDKNGNFSTFSMRKIPPKIVAIECENATVQRELLYFVSQLKSQFKTRRLSNTGIIFSLDKIKDFECKDRRILLLSFGEKSTGIVKNGSSMGMCSFEVLPYPQMENLSTYYEFYNTFNFDFKLNDGKIVCDELFFRLEDLEKKLIDFARYTSYFDKNNDIISRVVVNRIVLPIETSDYYYEYFNFLPQLSEVRYFDSELGSILSNNTGAFVCINAKSDNYEKETTYLIGKFVEDING